MFGRRTKKAAPVAEPAQGPVKVPTLDERHLAFNRAVGAINEVLKVLDHGDIMDKGLASVLSQAVQNLDARLSNERRIVLLAMSDEAINKVVERSVKEDGEVKTE